MLCGSFELDGMASGVLAYSGFSFQGAWSEGASYLGFCTAPSCQGAKFSCFVFWQVRALGFGRGFTPRR